MSLLVCSFVFLVYVLNTVTSIV